MTGNATFGLDYIVFKAKWTGYLGMALGADEVLLCSEALKLLTIAPVGFVTIGATNQPLYCFVAERLGKV